MPFLFRYYLTEKYSGASCDSLGAQDAWFRLMDSHILYGCLVLKPPLRIITQ